MNIGAAIKKRQRECIHWLESVSTYRKRGDLRYRCVRCEKYMKVASGLVLDKLSPEQKAKLLKPEVYDWGDLETYKGS